MQQSDDAEQSDLSLEEVVRSIQRKGCEGQSIEVKAASQGTPKVYDSLSSFSNQNEGGIIVFGLDESLGFEVVGVHDAQELEKAVTAQGKEMYPEVRPVYSESLIDGKTVVSAYINGKPMGERPVYRKTAGISAGSYTRIGDADARMTPTQLYEIETFKDGRRDDVSVDPQADSDMLNPGKRHDFISRAQRERPLLARRNEDEILELSGVCRRGSPTLAGLMTLGEYPQQVYPNLCITAVVVPGTKAGTGLGGERFLDNQRFEGTIDRMLEDAMAFVRRNSRTRTVIRDGVRTDIPEYPETAVREILTNALMHRDYGPYCNGTPVRLTLFADRLECWNPGGVYGGQSINDLGFANSQTRNPTLVSLLEIEGIAENRHSGIPAIREEAKQYGYKPVEFQDRQASFTVRFYSVPERAGAAEANVHWTGAAESDPAKRVQVHALSGSDASGAAKTGNGICDRILGFCKEPRSLEDIAHALGLGKYYVRRRYIEPLLEEDALSMTLPDKPRSKYQRYVASDASAEMSL